jgi:excisionase family DNA binding protein
MKIDKNRPMYSLSVEEYIQLNKEILSEAKLPEEETVSNTSEIMNIEEAAVYLKMAKQTVYSMISRKLLPYFKRGKRVFFRKAELLTWLEKGRKYTREEILSGNFKLPQS